MFERRPNAPTHKLVTKLTWAVALLPCTTDTQYSSPISSSFKTGVQSAVAQETVAPGTVEQTLRETQFLAPRKCTPRRSGSAHTAESATAATRATPSFRNTKLAPAMQRKAAAVTQAQPAPTTISRLTRRSCFEGASASLQTPRPATPLERPLAHPWFIAFLAFPLYTLVFACVAEPHSVGLGVFSVLFFCLSALSLGLFVFSVFSPCRCSFRPSSSLRLQLEEFLSFFFVVTLFLRVVSAPSVRTWFFVRNGFCNARLLSFFLLESQVRRSSLAILCLWSRFQVH